MHGEKLATDVRNAAFAGDVELALAIYAPAVAAGLRDAVLICGAREASNRQTALAALDRSARLAWVFDPTEDPARGRLRDRGRIRATLELRDGRRRPPRSREVEEAAHALIAFVQRELAELENEAASEGVDPIVDEWFAVTLQATQRLAFSAMRVSRTGEADAKRIQITVSHGRPLAICERCRRVFADNATVFGRSKITRLCRDRCRHA